MATKEKKIEQVSANDKKVPFPGTFNTVDGSAAVVWVESHISQGGCAYPITPSTTMGQGYQAEVSNGKKNLWGETLAFIELESEHSSASSCEGFALAGGRVANFTSGQGLILMKEVLYTISGKRLPVVFHIGARALTSHSLNIHAGHDDVMGVADCGWGMLFARNNQEILDLALISRRAAESAEVPFLNIQDGFLATHTTESVHLPEPEMMKQYVGDPNERIKRIFDPENPLLSGPVQNQDSYMKGKIAQRFFYDPLKDHLLEAMREFTRLTGRTYDLIIPYKLEDAEYAIVGMGTMLETAKTTVDYLREKKKMKVGCVHITAFRPFPGAEIVSALKNMKAFAVVERMDNPPAQSNPLTAEIKSAFADALGGAPGYEKIKTIPVIYSGSAGLGSRDVRPGDFIAVFDHMRNGDKEQRYFVLNIKHPLALERKEDPDIRREGSFSMRGHSIGGYGSVTTNKVIASMLADAFGVNVQAYPKYGSEKKGLPTTFYLTAAPDPIETHSELEHIEFVALNDTRAFHHTSPLSGLKDGGAVFLQASETSPKEVWLSIPQKARKEIRKKNLKIFALDTIKIAREVSPEPDLEQRMQGIVLLGVFLRATPFRERAKKTEEVIFKEIENSIRKYFGRRGEEVVSANMKAIERGYKEAIEIPKSIMEKDE